MVQLDLFGKVVQDLPADADGDMQAVTETTDRPRSQKRGRGRGRDTSPPPQKRGRGRGRARVRARIVGAVGDTTIVCDSPSADVGPTVGGTAVDSAAVDGTLVAAAASVDDVSGGVVATLELGTIVSTSSTLTFDNGIYCTKCGYTVDPMVPGTRVVRKSPPMFVCSKCNSKTVMLTRMFGSWPPEEFKGLDDATMRKFWATQVADKDALRKAVEDTLVSRLVESQIAEESGPYLPLATWAEAPYHFDPAEIKAKAPMRMHHILGETYQVKIVTTGERKQRDVVRETMAKMMRKIPGLPSSSTELPAITGDADADADSADDDESAADSASTATSSSSSASSSSTDGRKKKSKKTKTKSKKSKKPAKKQKKAHSSKKSRRAAQKDKENQRKAAKEEAAAHRAEKSRIVRLKTECSKVLGKVTPITMQLDQTLKDKMCSQIPSVVMKKSQDVLATLTAYEKEAKDKLKAKCPLDLTFTVDSVLSLCKEATMHKNHLTILIDSVRKM